MTSSITSDDDLALFAAQPPTLFQLASVRFAISIWTDTMLSGIYHDVKDTLRNTVEKTARIVLKLIKRLHTTEVVKNQISRSLRAMSIDLELWMIYNEKHLLPYRRVTLYTCHLKCCVWKYNGDIDFKESARNMISKGFFGAKENFEMMSRFCMIDDLNKLPIDEKFRKYVNHLTLRKTPVSFYWRLKLTDELHEEELGKIPQVVWRLRGHQSVEGFMIALTDADNWPCIEYFYDCLSENEQVSSAIELLKNDENPTLGNYLKKFYWKMNEAQRNSLFSQIPVELIMLFFKQLNEPESAFLMWTRLKNSMTGAEFLELLNQLFHEFNSVVSTCREGCIPMVKKLWNSADDRHKDYVLEIKEGSIVRHLMFTARYMIEFDPNLELLYAVLSWATPDYRKQLIFDQGDIFIILDENFARFDEFIQLCLPDAKDVAEFKHRLTDSFFIETLLHTSFLSGKFAYVSDFLQRYFPGKRKVIETKKHLLEMNLDELCKFCIFEPKIWSEFEKFIDSVGLKKSESKPIKKAFIRSFRYKCFQDRARIDQLDLMENLVAIYLNEKETTKMKKNIIKELEKDLIFFIESYVLDSKKCFQAGFLKKLLSWCLADEQTVTEFKQNFHIDEIFSESIRALMRLIRQDDPGIGLLVAFGHDENIDVKKFAAVEEFLKWYLNDDEAAKAYKTSKIFAFDDVEFFSDLVSIAEIDMLDAKTLIRWFLNDDEEQIIRFKMRCDNDTLANLI